MGEFWRSAALKTLFQQTLSKHVLMTISAFSAALTHWPWCASQYRGVLAPTSSVDLPTPRAARGLPWSAIQVLTWLMRILA